MNISISNAIQSSAISGGGEPSALPLALDLSITGGFAIGSVQTGNYTYFDPNTVAESGTTFKWYRVDGSTRTEVGTAQSYTLVAADEQKAIEFEVTPRNADTLVGPTASVQKNIPLFPVPPTATNVSFTGTLEIGQQMQGSYDYGDINGDPESGTTFKWFRANLTGGTGAVEISGATSINYTLTTDDSGKYIQFQVTPRNDIGEVGSMSASSWRGAVNSIPIALYPRYISYTNVGEQVTSSFSYYDNEGDPQGTTLYQWFTSPNSDGSGATAIAGATSANYTIVAADEGNYLAVRITPVTQSGIQGLPAFSEYESDTPGQNADVGPLPTVTNVIFTGTLIEGQVLTRSYTYDSSSAPQGISTFKWYNNGVIISGATSQNYTLQTSDIGDYISYEVTPVSGTGVQGSAVTSAAQGPIAASGYVLNDLEMLLNFTDTTVSSNKQYVDDASTNSNKAELLTGKAVYFSGGNNTINNQTFNNNGGTADYITLNSFKNTLTTGTAFTIAMWFKSNAAAPNPNQPYRNIMLGGIKSTPSQNVLKFGPSSSSVDGGFHFAEGTTNSLINNTVNYNDNVWHRLVISRQSGSGNVVTKWYIDGTQISIGSDTSNIAWSNLDKLSFGMEYDGVSPIPTDFYKGLISDVQIYDKNWLQADVTFDYLNPNILVTDSTNTGTAISLTNLKGYWAMSEGAGSLIYDSSGEGNNGAIIGAIYDNSQPRIPQLGMQNWSKGSNELLYSSMPSSQVGSNLTWETFAAAPNTITVTGGQTAPDGTSTAYLVNGIGAFYQTNIDSSIQQTRRSVWAKTVSGTGTVKLMTHNSHTNNTFTITNNWQRFDLVPNSNFAENVFYAADLRGGTTLTQVIVWGPQAQSNNILNDYRPTDANVVPVTTLIPKPNTPTKDVYANPVRNRDDSFNLDGIGYATIADSTSLNISNGTLQFWLKTTDTVFTILSGQSSNEFIGKANVTWFNGNAGNITVYKDNVTSSPNNTVDTDGNWHFYTFTGINVSSWTEFNISNLATFELDGLLDSVFIYSDVLTSDEIIKNYNFTEPDHQ